MTSLMIRLHLMRCRKRKNREWSVVEVVMKSKEYSATLDEVPGTLYWADWPDPKSARIVNSRTAVSIDNERDLCTLLRSMGYKYVQFSPSFELFGSPSAHGNPYLRPFHSKELTLFQAEQRDNRGGVSIHPRQCDHSSPPLP